MADLSKLSDEELLALVNGPAPAKPRGVKGMSDDELMAIIERTAPQAGGGFATRAQREGSQTEARQGEYLADAMRTRMDQDKVSPLGRLDAYGRGIVSWVPGMDKLAAAGDAAFGAGQGENFGERYDDRLLRQRAQDEADRLVMPGSRRLGQAAGLVATAAALPSVQAVRAGGLAGDVINAGATGAVYGGITGGVEEDGTWEQKLEAAKRGAGQGALIGAAVPVAARAASAGLQRLVTPMPISPERQAAVDRLAREGVNVSAGQRSGSKALQYLESYFGDAPFAGGKATAAMERQGEELTDAAMRRLGGPGGRMTEDVLNTEKTRMQRSYQDLANRNTLHADQQLGQDLADTLRRYELVLEPQQSQLIGRNIVAIIQRLAANGGTMTGAEYQMNRSIFGTAAQGAAGNNNNLANAFRGLRDALDNAMTRSITNPADALAWRITNNQWKNLKTLAPAGAAAGENAASGLISPAQLRMRATSGKNAEGYALGRGDFTQLAKDANQVMSPLPNSGTAQRTMLFGQAGGVGSAMVGAANPAVAVALIAGPALMGRALWSGPVQRYLSNNVITPAAQRAIEARLQQIGMGGVRTQATRSLESDKRRRQRGER